MSDSEGAVVIVGAGHAGGTVAALLRQYDHKGPITLLGEEPIIPYQRPPLSKAWLAGKADSESLALRPEAFYGENEIAFRPGVRVESILRDDRSVLLAGGERLTYERLIIATGARATQLRVAGADFAGVTMLRTAADADRLKALLGPGRRLVIVGGGYIGLEVAASARALGAEVVVVERESRLLARVACEPLSQFFMDYHQRHGVVFELGSQVAAFEGRPLGLTGVRLSDGRILACDAAVIGVGATPNDELAAGAGLAVENGIVVDLQARSSDPDMCAIGDVSRRPMPLYDRMFRVESVPNALEQAKQAASAITGRPPPKAEVPWQWSDQYDLKLQIAGYAFDADEVVIRGDPDSRTFAVFHLSDGRLQAVEAVNSPADFMGGKLLIAGRARLDSAMLGDPGVSLKDLIAASQQAA